MTMALNTALLVRVVVLAAQLGTASAADTKALPRENLSIRPFIGVTSVDTYPVSIEAGGRSLVVPRNYLDTAIISLGKVFLGITTTYPQFGGATRETFLQFQSRNAFFSPNTILIARRTDVFPSYAEINKARIQEAVLGHGKHRADGLIELDSDRDVLVGLTDSKDKAVIICDHPTEPSARCTVGVDVAAGLAFSYQYDRSMLQHWRDVHLGVVSLLRSFVRG